MNGKPGPQGEPAPQSEPVPAAEPEPPPAVEPDSPDLGPSPLHVVGQHGEPLALFGLGDVGFVRAGDALYEIRDGEVAYDRTPNRGLPSGDAYEDFAVAGEWPDTAFVVATRTDHNRRRTELFFWDGHRWKSKLQTRKSSLIRSLAPWNRRRVLALLHHVKTPEPSFRVVAGFPLHPVPKPAPSDDEGCKARISHVAAAFLRTGDVFAAGSKCPDGSGAAVEHWAPGRRDGTVHPLPESQGVTITSIVARDSSTAIVGGHAGQGDGTAYLAGYDGTTWARSSAPLRAGVSQLAVGPKGTLWAVTRRGALWKRATSSAWEQVPMPAVSGGNTQIGAVRVWPRAADNVWVVGRWSSEEGEDRWMLLHSKPHDGTIAFDEP